jgi:hypothetical protein
MVDACFRFCDLGPTRFVLAVSEDMPNDYLKISCWLYVGVGVDWMRVDYKLFPAWLSKRNVVHVVPWVAWRRVRRLGVGVSGFAWIFAFGPGLPGWRFCSCLFPRPRFFPLARLVSFKLEHLSECSLGG